MSRSPHRSVRALLVLAIVLATASVLPAAVASTDLFVPSVARAAGTAGSQWYTTVWIHNPGDQTAPLTVSLLLRDQANPAPDQQQLAVEPGHTLTFQDAILQLFGLQEAVGALRVEGDRQVVVGARVFNLTDGGLAESQGQFMAGLPAAFAVGAGGSTDVPGITQPAGGDFRCNFGVVETTGSSVRVRVTLLDGAGVELASDDYQLAGHQPMQSSLTAFAPGVSVSGGRLHVAVTSGSGRVVAYGSMVGNGEVSQDPSTLEMELESGQAGVITEIIAGDGLTGGGSSGAVTLAVLAGDGLTADAAGLTVAPEGITVEMIAADQVVEGLVVDGDTLRGEVALEAGDNITLSADGDTVTVEATGPCTTRVETSVTSTLQSAGAGEWLVGGALLELPFRGRWRVGYDVVAEVANVAGPSTLNDPVSLALVDVDAQVLIPRSVVHVGLPIEVGLVSSATLPVAREVVVDAASDGVAIALAVRSSRPEVRLTVSPDSEGATYLWAECIAAD